jgi:hypothetical protein
MTWIALLLTDPSPCLRWSVLTELLDRPADDLEVLELGALKNSDPFLRQLADRQDTDGSWGAGDVVGSPHNRLLTTSQALLRLGMIGFDKRHPVVSKAADYLFEQQHPDGSWPLPDQFDDTFENESYSMIPLQTALPLRALAACRFATDPRAEKAYDWLIEQRLEDGAWPTGLAAGSLGRVAGYRRLPHSRWGCRANTTAALCCLALHPKRRLGEAAQRALDLLLGRETQEASNLGFEVARTIGFEPYRGFLTYFAKFDPGLVLWLCARIGASTDDLRVEHLVDFIRMQQGPYGLWVYVRQPQASRWVTFDLLRSLKMIDNGRDWVSLEPPTPFKPEPYGKRPSRY